MKCALFFAVAVACVLGVALANYNFVPVYPGTSGGAGNGSFLGLIGMLFLLMILFGNNNGSTTDQILLVNSTLEG